MCLLGGQSEVLLGLLDFPSERSDFVVLFFDKSVESLNLFGHHLQLSVSFRFESLPGSFGFGQSLLVLVKLSTDSLELALKFVESSC